MRYSIVNLVLAASAAFASPVDKRQSDGYGLTLCTNTGASGHCEEKHVVNQGCQVIYPGDELYGQVSSVYTPNPRTSYPGGQFMECHLFLSDNCHSSVLTYNPYMQVQDLDDPSIDGNDRIYSYQCYYT